MKKFIRVSVFIILSLFMGFSNMPLPVSARTTTSSKMMTQEKAKEKFVQAQMEKRHKVRTEKGSDKLVRVIVQTNAKAVIDGGDTSLASTLKKEIKQQIPNVVFKQDLSYLLSGFSLDIPENQIYRLEGMKGIKSVKRAKVYYPVMTDAVTLTKATSVWNDFNYKGQGMVVSIIDTGIDVNHKDMRLSNPSSAKIKTIKQSDDTAFTLKVPYGHNYADGNDIVKDDDSRSKSMHGMHVAGIVAANATESDLAAGNGILGVAPEAQLLAMKVFSNDEALSGAYSDAIVAAIEDSVLHEADVINMSLGSQNGFTDPEDPEVRAIKKATEQGVVVLVAAGNEGTSTSDSDPTRIPENTLNLVDYATVGSPATGLEAFTVASMNNSKASGFFGEIAFGSETESFAYKLGNHRELFPDGQLPVVSVGAGEEYDYDGKDVTNKIAFIRRGSITFKEKLDRAKEKGAIAAIVANNQNGEFGMAGIEDVEFPSATVSNEQGDRILELIEANADATIQFSFEEDFTLASEPSAFTSYGPTPELEFKPEIMAPGGFINSTLNDNKYGEMSGTSMATPHAAGAMALLIGKLKQENINSDLSMMQFARLSLTNTAMPLVDKANGTDVFISPRRQGAGAINIANALINRVLITEENNRAVKALKEVENTATFKLKIKNYGDQPVSYTIKLSTVNTELTDETTHQVKATPTNATVTLANNEDTISLNPQEMKEIEVTINLNDAPKNRFVEGFIKFEAKDSSYPSLSFPYMGFNGNWSTDSVLDKPIHKDGSVFNRLGLINGSDYLGSSFDYMTFSSKVNHDNVAISPNGDSYYDDFRVALGLVRNAKEVGLDIVSEQDDNATPIVHLNTSHNISKPLYREKDGAQGYFANGYWDGSVYNSEKGEYEPIADGSYFVRVKATAYSKNPIYHYEYLPFKVDTTKPTLELVSKGIIGDNYVVKFKASDTGVGFEDDGVGAFVDDNYKEDLTADADGVYTYEVPLTQINDGEKHTITIGAIDKVFNTTTQVIVPNAKDVVFFNAPDKVINSKNRYLSDDKTTFNLLGYIGDDVKSLTVQNNEVEFDDSTFSVDVEVAEGENEISYSYVTEDGTTVEDSFTIEKDTTPPTLEITNIDLTKPLVLSSSAVEVEGNITDNLGGELKVKIGNNLPEAINPDGSFSGSANVDFSRILKVRAIDAAGNETVVDITTIFEKDDEPFKIYFDRLATFEYLDGTSDQVVDGKLQMKGHVNKKVKALYIDGKEVAIDEALRFSTTPALQEGGNHIGVKVIGLDDSIIFDTGYTIYYDITAPSFNLDIVADEDEVIHTNEDQLTISGSVSDNANAYRLFINGNEIISNKHKDSREFTTTVDVKDQDTLLIEVVDDFNNGVTQSYTISVDKVPPVITVADLDQDELVIPSVVTVGVDDDKATTTISLDGQPYNGETITTPGNHHLVVVSRDKAGNESRYEKDFMAKVTYSVENEPTISYNENELPDFKSVITVKDSLGNPVDFDVVSNFTPNSQGDVVISVKLPDGSDKEVVVKTMMKPMEKPPVLEPKSDTSKQNNLGRVLNKVKPTIRPTNPPFTGKTPSNTDTSKSDDMKPNSFSATKTEQGNYTYEVEVDGNTKVLLNAEDLSNADTLYVYKVVDGVFTKVPFDREGKNVAVTADSKGMYVVSTKELDKEGKEVKKDDSSKKDDHKDTSKTMDKEDNKAKQDGMSTMSSWIYYVGFGLLAFIIGLVLFFILGKKRKEQ